MRSAALICVLLWVGFAFAIGVNIRRGRNIDCGCFGRSGRPVGWATLLEDVLLLGIAVVLLALPGPWLGAAPWSVFRLEGANLATGIGALGACCAAVLLLAVLSWIARSQFPQARRTILRQTPNEGEPR